MSTSGGPAAGGATYLLATHQYAPSVKATYNLTAASALAAIDSTNATISFKTNATGVGSTQVLVRLSASMSVSSTGQPYWGVFTHGSTQIGSSWMIDLATAAFESVWATTQIITTTASTNYQWDFAAGNIGAGTCSIFAHSYTAEPAGHDGSPLVMEIWAC